VRGRSRAGTGAAAEVGERDRTLLGDRPARHGGDRGAQGALGAVGEEHARRVVEQLDAVGAYPPGTVETIPTPAPTRSISGPTLEKAARKFLRSLPRGGATYSDSGASAGNVPVRPIAETASASASLAGKPTGARPSLPAATTTSVPRRRASSMAARVASSGLPPPRLMLTRSQPSSTAASIALMIE
jgi:hypothetical protein